MLLVLLVLLLFLIGGWWHSDYTGHILRLVCLQKNPCLSAFPDLGQAFLPLSKASPSELADRQPWRAYAGSGSTLTLIGSVGSSGRAVPTVRTPASPANCASCASTACCLDLAGRVVSDACGVRQMRCCGRRLPSLIPLCDRRPQTCLSELENAKDPGNAFLLGLQC